LTTSSPLKENQNSPTKSNQTADMIASGISSFTNNFPLISTNASNKSCLMTNGLQNSAVQNMNFNSDGFSILNQNNADIPN
jgi:hypothetical protein